MQLLPRNKSLFTLFLQASSITLVWIFKFSSKKVAGLSELAWIPPTLAAANTTTSGLFALNHSLTKLLSDRSRLFLFGWRFVKKKKGFFYSDDVSHKEFSRLGENVIQCNQTMWIKKKNIYKKNLISFNYKNSLLKSELKI